MRKTNILVFGSKIRPSTLLKKKNWDRGALARDKNFDSCFVKDEKACYYCAVGILCLLYEADNMMQLVCKEKSLQFLTKCKKKVGRCLMDWNDDSCRHKAEVVKLFESVEKEMCSEFKEEKES